MEYWSNIKSARLRISQIRKTLESRRKRRRGRGAAAQQKQSGADRVEFQLFLDVRSYIQDLRGFVFSVEKSSEKVNSSYQVENLSCWNDFHTFIQQYQT